MQLVRSGRGRDLRVDFCRGLALWWIFTDHIAGNVLNNYSLHNVTICDAAEVFVLLAGFAGAKAYAGVMDRSGWRSAAVKAIKRARTLYLAHLLLFAVYATQVWYAATVMDQPQYVAEIHLEWFARVPFRAVLESLLLRYQPSLLNILPLYVVLLLMYAAAMPLLHRPWRLVALSVAVYLTARIGHINLPGWGGTGWYFDPLAWQFLFVTGALLGYVPLRRPRTVWPLDVLAVLVLGFGLVMVRVVHPNPSLASLLPVSVEHALVGADKTYLSGSRLISILALVWVVARLVPVEAAWLRSVPAGLVELLGQHSLPVFCTGIVLGFPCQIALAADPGPLMQFAVNGGGALIMLLVAATAAWLRQRPQPTKAAASAVEPRPPLPS